MDLLSDKRIGINYCFGYIYLYIVLVQLNSSYTVLRDFDNIRTIYILRISYYYIYIYFFLMLHQDTKTFYGKY